MEYLKATYISLVLFTLIFILLAAFFICVALFYDKIVDAVKIVLYVFAGVSVALAIFYPVATVLGIRSYPKHRKLTHFFVKENVLKDCVQPTNDER